MAELPVTLGVLDDVPPAIRYRVRDVLGMVQGGAFDGVPAERLARLLEDGEPWLGAEPSLVDVGLWMTETRHPIALRRAGCMWLAMFPSLDSVTRLAELARDSATPISEQAIAALGDRQVRARHPSTSWPVAAVQLADETLVELAHAATNAGKLASEQLPMALRHVQWEGASASFARAPGLWGDALDCFASPALARVLLVCFEDVAPRHRMRVLRLVAAVLGEEAVPMLLARAQQSALGEKLEMLQLVIALAGEAKLGALEDAVRGLSHVELVRQRAKWHLQHRGVVPTVRGARVARSTAVMPIGERVDACARAADDLGALTKFARHGEAYVYTLWGWMVRGAGDPVRARELVAAHPESQRLVRDLYLVDLARRGRVKQLSAAAQTLQAADLGALQLAIWGRPLAALELAATARVQTPELVAARTLACYRAGRPDLARRVLDEDLPPSEIVGDDALPAFPGPNERWLVKRAPDARPAIAALAELARVVALAKPAPFDAEPDTASIESIAAVVRRLERGLAGSTVYFAGDLAHKDALVVAIEKAGARIVNGPFPGTDYYIYGNGCSVQMIAQLERQGARRLLPNKLVT